MEQEAVGVFLLSGFFSLSSASPLKTFHFVPEKLNWSSARTHCSENHVDLASISDENDLALLVGLVDTADDYAFVGLRRAWQWVMLERDDRREAQITFSRFADGQPDSVSDCGMITPSGEWTTGTCNTDLPFFCYDANLTQKFVKPNETKNWGLARNYCRQNHTDLPRIRNPEENQQLLDLYSEQKAWIGLTRRVWTWSDGTYLAFAPWVSGQTVLQEGKHCSALRITRDPPGFVQWFCNDTLPFFCYSFPRKTYTLKIKMSVADSAVNLADTAATDSLKKLVQAKLSDAGMSQDVHLTWSKRPQKIAPAPPPDEPPCPLNIKP